MDLFNYHHLWQKSRKRSHESTVDLFQKTAEEVMVYMKDKLQGFEVTGISDIVEDMSSIKDNAAGLSAIKDKFEELFSARDKAQEITEVKDDQQMSANEGRETIESNSVIGCEDEETSSSSNEKSEEDVALLRTSSDPTEKKGHDDSDEPKSDNTTEESDDNHYNQTEDNHCNENNDFPTNYSTDIFRTGNQFDSVPDTDDNPYNESDPYNEEFYAKTSINFDEIMQYKSVTNNRLQAVPDIESIAPQKSDRSTDVETDAHHSSDESSSDEEVVKVEESDDYKIVNISVAYVDDIIFPKFKKIPLKLGLNKKKKGFRIVDFNRWHHWYLVICDLYHRLYVTFD